MENVLKEFQFIRTVTRFESTMLLVSNNAGNLNPNLHFNAVVLQCCSNTFNTPDHFSISFTFHAQAE